MDAAATRQLKAEVRALALGWEANPSRDGLRVRFGSQARYASLVMVLDLMNQYNVKKYFLDLYHPRTGLTFYAFDGGLQRQRWHDPLLAIAPAPETPDEALAPPATPTRWARLTDANKWDPHISQVTASWRLLSTPEWEAPLAVLVVLAAVAVWRGRP